MLAKQGIVPVRTDLIDKIYAPLDPRYKLFGDRWPRARRRTASVENAIFNDNNGPWIKMINQAVFTRRHQGRAGGRAEGGAVADRPGDLSPGAPEE